MLQKKHTKKHTHKDKRFPQSELYLLGFVLSKITESNAQIQSHDAIFILESCLFVFLFLLTTTVLFCLVSMIRNPATPLPKTKLLLS